MYKILLSWRYLRTRFIALASIVSVTLGVATLIVVNSVMSGFVDQMKHRLHGVLSDIEMSAPLLSEIHHSQYTVEQIRELLGDDLEEVTCVVRTPALMAFQSPNGMSIQQQVILIGIDDETFGKVTDFEPYLQHAQKQTAFNFQLEDDGYLEEYGVSGWDLRRQRAEYQAQQERMIKELHQRNMQRVQQEQSQWDISQQPVAQTSFEEPVEPQVDRTSEPKFALLPTRIRPIEEILAEQEQKAAAGAPRAPQFSGVDPHAHLRPKIAEEDRFGFNRFLAVFGAEH